MFLVYFTYDSLSEQDRETMAGLVGLGLAYSLSLPGTDRYADKCVVCVFHH